MPPDLESFWTTAGFALIQGYGMTETTALVTLNHPFKIARGSIGKPLAGREVKIGDDGEILVRGDSIASQVWQQGRLQTRDPGWLATGDLAATNAEGELIFAGRKSDVIVTSAGLNIHPQDLEAVLRRQPGVVDVLVVAYQSSAGPVPAAVLLSAVDDAALQQLMANANRELALFQQIRYFMRWPQPEFPRTGTGKVLRRTVQSWAQQALSAGGASIDSPGDRLADVLHNLGAEHRTWLASDRLAEDLHLDSLALVQLQTTLETQFGVELTDAAWEQIKTVGDLRARLQHQPSIAPVPGPLQVPPAPPQSESDPSPAVLPAVSHRPTSQQIVFPRWPSWGPVRLVRTLFLEVVMRPLVWLLLGPRTAPPPALSRPSLLVANHLTAFDVPVILYALSGSDRDHVAVAMAAEMLTGWRQGQAQRHRLLAWFTPLAYGLVTALFDVFPLPRGAGLRQSFAHAGEKLDRGDHVLIFPEGRRAPDGKLQPFAPGIGLLARESEVPVQPIAIQGMGMGGRWPSRGEAKVKVRRAAQYASG